MNIKLEWLKELVDLANISLSDLVNKLSLHSVEVETAKKLVDASNLVVGFVKERSKLEDSDHLSLCKVDVGAEELQIICGAPNVDKGQKVIVALNGAILPNNFKIKKTKIRGVESNGMICSLLELGIEKKYVDEANQAGIYVFKDDVKVGSNALEALNLDDYVIEVDVTPNRGDLLSMLGLAVEVSAVFNRPLKPLAYNLLKEDVKDKLEVLIETNDCSSYFGRIFKDVVITSSPQWLISRLIAFGIRPINNVVDITNYILALFGQPLHAFDYKLLGSKILVRNAYENEEIITLDNQKRKLLKSDVVITNGKDPVAIAGVMGGAATEVTANTKDIVLEAAVFNKESVRKTSLRLDLRSDSSIRFEKGVDFNSTKLALDYATYLLNKYAKAKVGNIASATNPLPKVADIVFKLSDVEKILGVKIASNDIKSILERLMFKVSLEKDSIIVTPPSKRMDIRIKEDVVEEISRLYGYELLPITLPKTTNPGYLTKTQKQRRFIKEVLSGLGLSETITYALVDKNANEEFKLIHEQGENVEVLMPLSSERSTLRKSLVPSLVEVAQYSLNRKIKNLAFFEIGRTYYKDQAYKEYENLSILITNEFSKSLGHKEEADFFLLKGILENLFESLRLEVDFGPLEQECLELHPKRSAEIYLNKEFIGFIGALHPKYTKEKDLDDAYVAEIKLDKIFNVKEKEIIYEAISKVPFVNRDIAILVKKDVLVGDILKEIRAIKNLNLNEIEVFDLYVGDKIAKDEKSVAISLSFSANETLTDEQINSKITKILKVLKEKFNATLR